MNNVYTACGDGRIVLDIANTRGSKSNERVIGLIDRHVEKRTNRLRFRSSVIAMYGNVLVLQTLTCSGVVKVLLFDNLNSSLPSLGGRRGSATAAVFDMDSESSRIAFATSWTTAGPRGDDLGRWRQKRWRW
jgi:hypothetical protein